MGATLILLSKDKSVIGIGSHTSIPPSGTRFWWNIPALNSFVTNLPINPSQGPLNTSQSVWVPLSANDIIIPSNGQLLTTNGTTQLTFSSTNLKIMGTLSPGIPNNPIIPTGWSLLAIPMSYIPPVNMVGSTITLNIPSADIYAINSNNSLSMSEGVTGSYTNGSMNTSTWNNWIPSSAGGLVSSGLAAPGVNQGMTVNPSSYATPENSSTFTPTQTIVNVHLHYTNPRVTQIGTNPNGSPIYQLQPLQQIIPE
jgi:hypothetical protein